MAENQIPEQIARDKIDQMLKNAGWIVQDKNKVNLAAGIGIAIREYQTDMGLADYVLFVDQKSVGITEAKREQEGHRLTAIEDQVACSLYTEVDDLDFTPYDSKGGRGKIW